MTNNHINYVEFKAKDLDKIKEFYSSAFDWTFIEYGLSYVSFSESGIAGGFELSESSIVNGALIILYHNDLELIKKRIIAAGGKITREIFTFPGGHRFHFSDPSGNELAVWSDK